MKIPSLLGESAKIYYVISQWNAGKERLLFAVQLKVNIQMETYPSLYRVVVYSNDHPWA